MTVGVLGIIICPMNDDQMLYSLEKDGEISRIVLLDNPHSEMICKKLESKGLAFEHMGEKEFLHGDLVADQRSFTVVIRTNDLALHGDPKYLRTYVEDQVREMQPFVDSLGVYYGLCGNYGWDLEAWAVENGFKPLAVFKGDDGRVCDDCVAIAVGSSTRYLQLEKTYTGMFYVTPAIADNWVKFISAGGVEGAGEGDLESQIRRMPKEVLEVFGITDATSYMRWMFEIGNYTNLLKLYTGLSDRAVFDCKVDGIGRDLNLKPIDIGPGWVTLDPADALYNRAKSAIGS